MHINHRNDFPKMLNDMGLTGLGAEIGVWEACYAKKLLNVWEGKKLYLIDSWRHIDNVIDFLNVDRNGYLNAIVKTFMEVYDYGTKAVMIREHSVDAAKLFTDGSLDFVYIDASHDYKNVTADLKAWYPKVKIGGVVSGHDYADGMWEYPGGFVRLEVKRAVDEFFSEKDIQVTKENISETFISWYIIKKENL
jgi:hypothetical protein